MAPFPNLTDENVDVDVKLTMTFGGSSGGKGIDSKRVRATGMQEIGNYVKNSVRQQREVKAINGEDRAIRNQDAARHRAEPLQAKPRISITPESMEIELLNETLCAICQEGYGQGEDISMLRCAHY